MKRTLIMLAAFAVVALWAGLASAGEYHSGNNLLCYDCHTMHFSMQHGFQGGSVSTTPVVGGDWLSTSGPNQYLLKAPANQLCLACHDGQPIAPDVFGANSNTAPTQGREAGALNDMIGAGPYFSWTGHTLGSTNTPPGYDPVVVGASATWYPGNTTGLRCIDCHAQHGPATSYRNLGSYSLGGAASAARPTYTISTTNTTSKDVWVNIATGYVAGTGSAATFNPYYDRANIFFNRFDKTVGTTKSSNAMGVFCATCHGDFHGGPGDAGIGASTGTLDGFIRHPNAQVTIGAAGTQGYGGHSSLSQYLDAAAGANATRVKVATTDYTGYTDATPMCLTCHKAHGNQNAFGLIFLNRIATSVGEEGGLKAGQTATLPPANAADLGVNMRNLCGQCHSQGNS